MIRRELAWRILSGEFNATTTMIRSDGAKTPNYALTPLGAKINRVFIVGKATEKENIGTDSRTFYRIRLSDATGTFFVAVGDYQPDALNSIERIELPAYLAVVGKVKSYEPDTGGLYLSIRPESISLADEGIRDQFLIEAVESLKSRLEAVLELRKMATPSEEHLRAIGYPKYIAECIMESYEHYGNFSLDQYYMYMKDVLHLLVTHNGSDMEPSGDNKLSDIDNSSQKKVKEQIKNKIQIEKTINDIFKKKRGSSKLGINWNELLAEIKLKGIDRQEAEEVIRDLMDKGVIYEPVLGILKRIIND